MHGATIKIMKYVVCTSIYSYLLSNSYYTDQKYSTVYVSKTVVTFGVIYNYTSIISKWYRSELQTSSWAWPVIYTRQKPKYRTLRNSIRYNDQFE